MCIRTMLFSVFVVLFLFLAISLVYVKIKKRYSYWTDRGIKQRKQIYLLGDQAGLVFKTESTWEIVEKLYNAFPEERYIGLYQFLLPTLMVRDPELIKRITIKDFDHFVDHRSFAPTGIDPLWSRNLLMLKGDEWHDMRSALSPSFTSSKMKILFSLLLECVDNFTSYYADQAEDIITLELKDAFARFTSDAIAAATLGVNCDSARDRNNEFYLMSKEVSNFSGFWNNLKLLIMSLSPTLSKVVGLKVFSNKVRKFFQRVVTANMKVREENNIIRPDMLHLLMETKKEGKKQTDVNGGLTAEETGFYSGRKIIKRDLSELDITAQVVIFLFGGLDSISSLLCFAGHELAINTHIQRKLQKEIDEVWTECEETITYDALMKMKYMDMVISETLRKWPVAALIDRVCVKPYTIEPTRPNEKPVHLKEGDVVWISIIGLQNDSTYFPNPELFDPERFNEDNKTKIDPDTYFPFGIGPRICIGNRFALMNAKILLFYFLRKFDFIAVAKTQKNVELEKNTISLRAKGGLWVGLRLRSTV